MTANSKPKLLHINTVADRRNSVGSIMNSIATHARAAGWDTRIAAGRGDVSAVDYRIGGIASVLTHVAASRLNDCEGMWSRLATKRFLQAVDNWKPDIVHLHNLHGHFINIPILFQWLAARGLPVVMTLHDCWWLTGHCSFFSHLDCSPANGCVDCRHTRDEYPTSLLSQSASNFNRKRQLLRQLPNLNIVVPTQWTESRLNEAQLNGLKCRVIAHGIDTDVFSPNQSSDAPHMILAVAARWEKRKNLEAINRLAESGQCKSPITVVGHLMGQTLHEHITYIPPMESADELTRLYSDAALLINPSTAETFGLTALEAMACGTPVIVNANSAVAEIVTPQSGIATNVDDPQNLSKAISDTLTHRERFDPRTVALGYSSSIMADKYISLYESLLK